MTWAQYQLADLDLSAQGPIINSRPYVQGRQSLDLTKIFVRFIGDEIPWSGGTQYATREEAKPIIRSTDYVAPPTAEEIEQEAKAVKQSNKERLRRVVSVVRTRFSDDLAFEAYVATETLAEAEAVKVAGYAPGTSDHIDDLVGRLRKAPITVNKITAICDGIITDAAELRTFMLATENIYKQGLKAINNEEDFKPFIDELRAL